MTDTSPSESSAPLERLARVGGGPVSWIKFCEAVGHWLNLPSNVRGASARRGDSLGESRRGELKSWSMVWAFGALAFFFVTRAAELPDDWAFHAIQPSTIPSLKPGTPALNPIDAFVGAKLAELGIQPLPEADRRTLIRRLSFDLTGLPPAPEVVEAFVRDDRPDAYSRCVDQLLASPQYGERWARHWLDVVRFGESQGFEYDRIREHAWRYRDYVINAFNTDKPYYQFVREQLAGDVWEPITEEGIVATGFLVAGPWDQAGNSAASASLKAMVREAELEDILGTIGQTFLGVTLNCARCHNHKFDPVPQRDYYQVKAVFQGVRHSERSILTPAAERELAGAKAAREARLAVVESQLARLEGSARARVHPPRTGHSNPGELPAGPSPWARWTFEGDARDSIGSLHGELVGGARIEGGRLHLDGQGAFLQTGPLGRELTAKTLEVWVTLSSSVQQGGGALAIETSDGQRFDAITFAERQTKKWMVGSEGYRRTRDLEAPEESSLPGEWICLTLVYQLDGSIALFRNGEPYGSAYTPTGDGGALTTFAATSRVLLGRRHTGGDRAFLAGEIEEARLYDRALTAAEVAASFRAGPAAIMVSRDEILAALTSEERHEHEPLAAEREQLNEWLKRPPPLPQGYVARAEPPGPTFVLLRGEADKPRDPVSPGTLSAVKMATANLNLSPETPEAERRRRFADWVVDANNPLTSRVIVNRVWQHHFGRGLVATPNDFGKMGERPSHPELLDWLAAWFVASEGANWSLKRLQRLMVTSATYRQASELRPNPSLPAGESSSRTPNVSLAEDRTPRSVDADNRFLWRFTPRRLEAETVRDAMLAMSGELNSTMGGPGFRPFNHRGNGGQNEYFAADLLGPEFNRRTVYRICVHSARDPMLDSLDCPEFSTRTPVRPNTTTPLQALSLMNNSLVQRQAAQLAERVIREAGRDPDAQVTRLWQYALGREPIVSERASARSLAQAYGLAQVSWALLNSNEFVFLR